MHPMLQLVSGMTMLIATVAIHLLAIQLCFRSLDRQIRMRASYTQLIPDIVLVLTAISILSVITLAESMIWAAGFALIGPITDFWAALYFAIVTLTTLGYGDIVLGADARLIASLYALAGLFVMGLSTAFVVEILRRLDFRHTSNQGSRISR